MRIAVLHYTAPPVIGGVERVVGDQAAALRQLGHDVDVLTHADIAVRWHAGIRESAERCDAIIVHNVFTMPFDLGWTRELHELAAVTPKIRWVNWVHDVAAVNPHYAHLPWDSPEYALLISPPPHCAHVAVSKVRQLEYSHAAGLPPAAIQVISNGIDVAQVLGLTPRVADLLLWRHDLVLFHPARLIRRKNVELTVRAVAALRAAGIDAVCLVSGATDPHQRDGIRYLAELKELASHLDVLPSVRFLGEVDPLSDDDIRSLYAMADALFLPSTSEGFGLPLLEAVAHRLPVFCSDLAVHREVLGSEACFFDAAGSPEKIARDLIAWKAGAPEIDRRRTLWREHDMFKICRELVVPLLNGVNPIP